MAEKPSTKSRIYCADPFTQHKKKVVKDKSFKELNAEYVYERSNSVPELLKKWNEGCNFICKICVWKIKMKHERFTPPAKELESLSLQDETLVTDDEDCDPDYYDTSAEKSWLIGELEKIGVNGNVLLKRYISREIAQTVHSDILKKYGELKTALERIAGINISDAQQAFTDEGCKSCGELVEKLAERFNQVNTKEDKYKILTCVPNALTIADVSMKFGCSQHMARKSSKLKHQVGVYTCPPPKVGRKLDPGIIALAKDFFLSDANSRVDPSVRGTILVYDEEAKKRVPMAKRLILTTLSELYTEFKREYPDKTISISAFALQRPVWCVYSGNKGHHYSCTCILHENYNLMLLALKSHGHISDFISSIICSSDQEECFLGLCPICPNSDEIEKLVQNISYPSISYHYWGHVEGTYGIGIHEKTEPVAQFETRFKSFTTEILTHHFVMKKQIEFIEKLRKIILPAEVSSCMLQVDFAQNYSYVVQGAVQGYHWNNDQATVHPFVLTWFDTEKNELMSKSYIVLSDDMDHDAMTFHAFRTEVIKQMKKDGFQFNKIYYFSDGAGSQYKNKFNFVNLLHHLADFGIKAVWHFHAASHGKSQCDAMGAVVKRVCRLASLNVDPSTKERVFITNVTDMGNIAGKKLDSDKLKIMVVSSSDVKSLTKKLKEEGRFNNVKTIAGTRLYHSFVPYSNTELLVQRYSLSEKTEVKKIFKRGERVEWRFRQDEFIAVKVGKEFTIGVIVGMSKENGYQVRLMRREKKGNSFVWPDVQNVQSFLCEEILKAVRVSQDKKSPEIFTLTQKEFRELAATSKN